MKSILHSFMQCVALAAVLQLNPHNASAAQALEPGQAEAKTTQTVATDVPTSWAHPAREARAVWITADELLKPRTEVAKKLDAIAATHFNAILVDTWFRGYVIYPGSDVVPQYPAASGSDDLLEWVIAEAHKRGLQVHNWPEYGCYAYHTKDAKSDSSRGALLDKHPELTATAADGSIFLHNETFGDFYSLCPANPATFDILSRLYVEMMTRYKFDGLNLDRLRFPAADFCYCSYCKEHFRADTGLELTAVDPNTPAAAKFLDWKRHKLADGVGTVVNAVRKARPGIDITAYVVGPDEMNNKAQSWDLWVQRGYLDAIAVSMYGTDIEDAAYKAQKLLGAKSNILIAALNAGLPDTSFLLHNIGVARQLAPVGQFVWYAADVMDDLEALKAGPYSVSAQWPLGQNSVGQPGD